MAGKAHGGPRKGSVSFATKQNKVASGYSGMSMHGARLLMPDEEGVAHARGIVAAGAQARYGLTEAEDALSIMKALGIAPSKEEDQDGC